MHVAPRHNPVQTMHSVLQPVSPQAHLVTALWWWMFGVATLVFLIVIAALGVAALRRNRKDTTPPMSHERDETHRGARWVAVTAGATALIVAAFLVYSIHV